MTCLCRSAPLAASANPLLETAVLLELPGPATADPSTLLPHRQPLHLVVLSIQPAPIPSAIVASDTSSSSSSSTASIGIAQHLAGWAHQGVGAASPPGTGSVLMHGHGNSNIASSGVPGTTARSASRLCCVLPQSATWQQSTDCHRCPALPYPYTITFDK